MVLHVWKDCSADMYRISQFNRRILFLRLLDPKGKTTLLSLEVLGIAHQTVQYHIPKDLIFSSHCENSDSGISDVWQTELNVAEPLLSELCVCEVEID